MTKSNKNQICSYIFQGSSLSEFEILDFLELGIL